MATPCKRVLGTCPPCDCANCGSIWRPKPTHCNLQQWLSHANTAGKKYGMNPVTLLAIASIETEGNASKISPDGSAYGIVQITKWYLNPYYCYHQNDSGWPSNGYRLTDLVGQGPNITTLSGAVTRSFDILAEFLIYFNNLFNSYRMSATAWNGPGCGQSGYKPVWGSDCGQIASPTTHTCYGQAAFDIAASHSPYWINPRTGQPDSFYWGDLSSVNPCTSDQIKVCLG